MTPELTTTIARQVIAETLLVFDVTLLVFIVRHMSCEIRRRGFVAARARIGNKAAVAIGVHVFGLTIIRGWTTLQYYLLSKDINPDGVDSLYAVPFVGLVFAVVGMACCIRIFSPAKWGNWGWILAFMAALGFVGWMQAP
jgi:hypothetical protein